MKETRTPNYGLDAPVAVRNMLIVAALGILSRHIFGGPVHLQVETL